MGNTFNDAISCLKMRIDLYTRLTYTQVYTVTKKNETQKIKQYQGCESQGVKTKKRSSIAINLYCFNAW